MCGWGNLWDIPRHCTLRNWWSMMTSVTYLLQSAAVLRRQTPGRDSHLCSLRSRRAAGSEAPGSSQHVVALSAGALKNVYCSRFNLWSCLMKNLMRFKQKKKQNYRCDYFNCDRNGRVKCSHHRLPKWEHACIVKKMKEQLNFFPRVAKWHRSSVFCSHLGLWMWVHRTCMCQSRVSRGNCLVTDARHSVKHKLGLTWGPQPNWLLFKLIGQWFDHHVCLDKNNLFICWYSRTNFCHCRILYTNWFLVCNFTTAMHITSIHETVRMVIMLLIVVWEQACVIDSALSIMSHSLGMTHPPLWYIWHAVPAEPSHAHEPE